MTENEYNNTWYGDETGLTPQATPTPPTPPKYEAKTPKKHAHKWVAFALAGGMLFSAILGFGGGMLAVNFVKTPAVSNSGSNVSPIQLASAGKNSFNAAAVAANSMDSVVEITTESMSRGNSIMGQFVSKGAGSGVIISADGYIATNNHVVANANKVTVRTRDGKEYKAKIIGTDERTDLAVIKIEAKGLNAAQYGTSKDIIVGQPVVAIGNPLGELGGTVTDGIISALDREVEVEEQKMTLLQTSAAVNPGNSGGGLFDGDGKLIGIVNAKSSGSGVEGLGFAIPIDTARGVIEQITKNGYVTGRVDIGMNFMDVDEQAAYMYRLSEPGVYIKEIVRGSYAEQAGLMPGDRVITVDGKKIESSDEVENIITAHKVGDKVDFRVERGAKQKTVSLTLAEEKPASPSLF